MSRSRVKEILRDLVSEGWVIISQNKHIKLRSPSGKSTLIVSSSPTCQYAHRHVRKEADKLISKENQ